MIDSTRNSQSPSPSPEEQSVQILVKNMSGETTSLTVPPSTSIATITSLLVNHPSSSERQPPTSSTNFRLTHAGRHLSPDSALSDHNIPSQSLLSLTSPLLGGAEKSASSEATDKTSEVEAEVAKRSGSEDTSTPPAPTEAEPAAKVAPATASNTSTPKKRKFPRCGFKSCTSPVQRIVGDCGFCGGKFCGKHRLLESHSCTGLEECREEEKRRNGERLGRERTVVLKGI